MVDSSVCEIIGTGTVKVTERDCSGGGLVYPGGTVQSNTHKGARQRRKPDPSAIKCHHS